MSVVIEVLEELWSMFVGDRRLTLLLLAVVAIAAALAYLAPTLRPFAGPLVLVGALIVLTDAVLQAARKR